MTPRRCIPTALAALTLVLAGPADAQPWLPEQGVVSVTLEEAVPVRSVDERFFDRDFEMPRVKYRGTPGHDAFGNLLIDLPVVDGQWSGEAWAWAPALPGVEHRGTVAVESADGEAVTLKLTLPLGHQLPLATGGEATYTLTIRPEPNGAVDRPVTVVGSYSGVVRGLDHEASQTLWIDQGRRLNDRREPGWRAVVHNAKPSGRLWGDLSSGLGLYGVAEGDLPAPDLGSRAPSPARRLVRPYDVAYFRSIDPGDDHAGRVAAWRQVFRYLSTAKRDGGATIPQTGQDAAVADAVRAAQALYEATDIAPLDILADGRRWQRWQRYTDPSTEPESDDPLVFADRDSGGFVFRSGWGERAFVTTFQAVTGPDEAAEAIGQFSVWGLGRWWVHPGPVGDPAVGGWPRRELTNTVQLLKAPVTRELPAYPIRGGFVDRVRANRDGSGVVSTVRSGWSERRVHGGHPDDATDGVEAKAWRVIAADYSGAMGAPAVIATFDTMLGQGPRERVWQAHLGVDASAVKIDGTRFTVSPEGTDATLTGTVVYPASAYVRYVPPTDRVGGILQVWPTPPKRHAGDLLEQSIDAGGGIDDGPGLIDLETSDDKANRQAERKRLRQRNTWVAEKIVGNTPSVKMGGGDRGPRTLNSILVVMTIQTGDPPEVEVLGPDHRGLARVGGKVLEFRPNLIVLHRDAEGGR